MAKSHQNQKRFSLVIVKLLKSPQDIPTQDPCPKIFDLTVPFMLKDPKEHMYMF